MLCFRNLMPASLYMDSFYLHAREAFPFCSFYRAPALLPRKKKKASFYFLTLTGWNNADYRNINDNSIPATWPAVVTSASLPRNTVTLFYFIL